MKTRRLLRQVAALETVTSRCVDCVIEARNNVERSEWDFAAENLRKLFANAAAIHRQRAAVLRELRRAREEHGQ